MLKLLQIYYLSFYCSCFSRSLARTYTYPVKSINLDRAPEAIRYTGLNPEANSWNTNTILDPHAVHGITASDGSQILVGKANSSSTKQDAFCIKVSSTGGVIWTWQSNAPGNDAANAVMELTSQQDNSKQLMVVGWKERNKIGRRSITVLSLDTGKVIWYLDDAFGDSQNSHGAFEMVDIDDTTQGADSSNPLIVLSGLVKKPNLSEMNFKSYGNVPDGVAIVQKFRLNELIDYWNRSNTLVTYDPLKIEWEKEFGSYNSAKAARFLSDGSVAALLFNADQGKEAAVAVLNKDNGSVVWRNSYPEHGEGTDLTIASDSDAIVITGHGGSNGEISGRLTKIQSSNGLRMWTKDFTVGGNPKLIYHECWGLLALKDGYALSCGTGIEDGRCSEVSGQDKIDCNEGRGDRREGAFLRKMGNWQSMVIKTDLNGELLWQRVDSHRCSDCVSMENPLFDSVKTGSSAAEWITRGALDDELIVITDEVFGVGILELKGGDKYCLPQDVIGRVFFVPYAGNCLRIEVGTGGAIIGDATDPLCNVKSGTGVTFSNYDGFSGMSSNWKVGTAGFSGTMDFMEKPNLDKPTLKIKTIDPSSKRFDVTIELPSCKPPPYCTAEQVAGSTFYAPLVGICFMIPLTPSALLVGDNNDATCANKSGSGIAFSVFQGFLPNTNVATFGAGQAGYSGIMDFARDPSLSSPTLINNGLVRQTFNVTLALPECPKS